MSFDNRLQPRLKTRQGACAGSTVQDLDVSALGARRATDRQDDFLGQSGCEDRAGPLQEALSPDRQLRLVPPHAAAGAPAQHEPKAALRHGLIPRRRLGVPGVQHAIS